MLFVGFYQTNRKQQTTFKQFYQHLTFVFKLLFILSFIIYINNQKTRNGLQFANIPSRSIHHHELWRLFTAPFATLDGFYGVISIINAFWWLLSLFPGYERKYSSIHIGIEIFIQNFIYQIFFCLFVIIILNFGYFQETFNDFFFTLGWSPLIIIWVFKYTGENIQKTSKFCFLPFEIKNYYLGWIVSATFMLLSAHKLQFIIASFLGWIQFHILKGSFIRLSVKNHMFAERLFSYCLYRFKSFIRIQEVQQQLRNICNSNKNYENIPTNQKQYNIDFDPQIKQDFHESRSLKNNTKIDTQEQIKIPTQNLI